MKLITVRGAPTEEQMVRLQLAFLKAKYRWAYLASWLMAIGFMITGVVLLYRTGRGGIIEPALIMAAYLAIIPFWFRWTTRQRLATPKNRAYFLSTIYEIDENEIRMMSEGGSSAVVPWTMIVEVRPWRDSFLLMLSENSFHLIYPQRFATAEEWRRFEQLARKRPLGKAL